MYFFWFWVGLFGIVWATALLSGEALSVQGPQLLGCGLFFVLFFLAPLFRNRPKLLAAFIVVAAAIVVVTFWTAPNESTSLYVLLILTLLIGKAAYRLPDVIFMITGGLILLAASLFSALATAGLSLQFLFLYALIIGASSIYFRIQKGQLEEVSLTKEALFSEYRHLKRYKAAGEKMIREQERTRIARDLHDSLGHSLTALLMQLEVLRLQSTGKTRKQVEQLKRLAEDSLSETRKGVRTLNQEEPKGIQAILDLIFQLEAESLVRINFSIGEGVLSTALNHEQAIMVYRAVQEALTNALKHSQSKQIEISLEAPSGRVFRFVIANPIPIESGFREGFGLASMRERMNAIDGKLEIMESKTRFIVEGTFPLDVS